MKSLIGVVFGLLVTSSLAYAQAELVSTETSIAFTGNTSNLDWAYANSNNNQLECKALLTTGQTIAGIGHLGQLLDRNNTVLPAVGLQLIDLVVVVHDIVDLSPTTMQVIPKFNGESSDKRFVKSISCRVTSEVLREFEI